jgi:phage shock protein PspC (stress-responsive transcriptional regulator)
MDAGAGTTRSDWTTGAAESQIPPWRASGTYAATDGQATGQPGSESTSDRGPLVRPRDGRMIAGVGAGLADYLGVDRTIIRLILFILAFVNGIGIVVYLAGWLLLPEDDGTPSVVQRALNR